MANRVHLHFLTLSLLLIVGTIPISSAFLTEWLSELFSGFGSGFPYGPGFGGGPNGRFYRPTGLSQGSGTIGAHNGFSPDYRGGGWSGPSGNGGLFNGHGGGRNSYPGMASLFRGGNEYQYGFA